MTPCANCHGPITGAGYAGRAPGDRPAPLYCCFGCLAVAERACGESACGESACGTGSDRAFAKLGFRLGVGLLVAGQSMIFGLALNLHDDVPPAARDLAQWLILAGTVLVAVLLGGPLVRAAGSELRRGRLTIELLFLLTLFGALAASLQAHLTGRGKIYYEVVSVLLVVYTLGKVIGARARAAALLSSRAWGDRLGWCRLLDEDGHPRTVPVADVRPGAVVEVHPGELIPVDGAIRDGSGFVSESAVSGEPFAVVRRPGDRVLAGAASFDATFRIVASASGHEREIDRLLKAVEEARDKPLSLQNRADRLGRWFLPLVVCTALGTFAYWSTFAPAGWETGLFNAMSVLLVACPCVIGLATPVVVWSALNRLAERGVIVHSGDALERLAGVDRVMFDKTGTLTEDRFALVQVETVCTGAERARLLGWLALVQARSNHPAAKPFADLPRTFAPGDEPRAVSLRVVPGCGVVADITLPNGRRHEMKIGTPAFVPGTLGDGSAKAPDARRVHVALDGALVAVATVAERLRDSAPLALARFAQLGLSVEVLTGDAPGRAEALGLPRAHGGMLPDEKRAAVERAKAEGAKPLFVGDGINDASALASAHLGVALASGTDLAVSAAPVTLYGADLSALPWAIELSRSAVRAVRLNLARSVAYNLVGMALAAGGVLHPVVAAVLMVVSSLTLIFSSSRVGCGHEGGGEEPLPPAPSPKKGGGESNPPPNPLPAESEDNLPPGPLPEGRG
ncbi:MAG TPA: cation-translocating P-type ATPase, partial [Gemmata sp.]